MQTTSIRDLTIDELVDHTVSWLKQLNSSGPLGSPAPLHAFAPLLKELATGDPVEPQRLATVAGLPLERTLAWLRQAPTEWDPDGERVVGLGLTSIPTRHRFEVYGHDLYVWCAVDALGFPVLIGAPAHIRSQCVATGDPIEVELTPSKVERVEPASAVVSYFLPDTDVANVREAACNRNNFYRSSEVAADWSAEHPQGRLMPVTEIFEVLRRASAEVFLDEQPPA